MPSIRLIHRYSIAAAVSTVALLSACDFSSSGSSTPPFEPSELRPGGDTSVDRGASKEIFSLPSQNLSPLQKSIFHVGDNEFEHIRSGQLRGPLLNAKSCQGCHVKDGRGNPPPAGDEHYMTSMFLRLSIGADATKGVIPDPIYGGQLQTYGIAADADSPQHLPGAVSQHGQGKNRAIGEAHAYIEYESLPGQYPDGSRYELRRPIYKVKDLSYGDFDDNILFSPRVAPSMIGLGLLGAIPESAILAKADPDDDNGDGISGRPNRVRDTIEDRMTLGRFGLKASTPSVLQQSAGAYRGDLGLTNALFDQEVCTPTQSSCSERARQEPTPHGARHNIDDLVLAQVEFYARNLAPPTRASHKPHPSDPVWRGRQHFYQIGCADCHTPRHTTGVAQGSSLGDVKGFDSLQKPASPIEALSHQVIWPYTDLLLHDMGGQCEKVQRERANGQACNDTSSNTCLWVLRCTGLADGRPDFAASGTEWRTAPLWGIGLVQQVNPNAGFLHDGRARTIEEAILWHAGEAAMTKQRFMALDKSQRQDLLDFVNAL